MKEENDLRVGGWVIIKDAAGVVLKGSIEICGLLFHVILMEDNSHLCCTYFIE